VSLLSLFSRPFCLSCFGLLRGVTLLI
jgi:hypothetical protein